MSNTHQILPPDKMEFTYDDLAGAEATPANLRHQRLLIAVLIAATGHLMVIYAWHPAIAPGSQVTLPLNVELRHTRIDKPATPQSVPKEHTNDETTGAAPTLPGVPTPAPLANRPIEAAPQAPGDVQLHLGLPDEISSAPLTKQQPRFRDFSTRDFPDDKPKADPYRHGPWLMQHFGSTPGISSSTTATGNLAVRRVDEFGNVTCLVKRDYGGRQPPMWFVAPASECP